MNHVPSDIVFLLGGYDLEMMTIKQMLEGRKDCVVLDHHLRWDNALLSAYQDKLPLYSGSLIYGIELQEDIPTPKNYHRIDHHNDMNNMPCSLEQVAALLGEPLNRHQLLVSANDKGYIPAMQAMGASRVEIDDIRRLDREAQGITEDDERLAEQSIANNLVRKNDLLVVRSSSPHFSPICDRLFPYKRLLVYTDEEWMYYGEGKADLAHCFEDGIRQKKLFHGGGEKGFIGSVKNAYGKGEILDIVERIIVKYEYI